jgi:hypothetical protein
MEAQALYVRLGHLIANVPAGLADGDLNTERLQWLAMAYTLVSKLNLTFDAAEIKYESARLHRSFSPETRENAVTAIVAAVHRALAVAELAAPVTAQGAFIPAGNPFDAHGAFAKVLGGVKSEFLLVDPYMDDKALVEYAVLAPEGITIRLLSDQKGRKPSLTPAIPKWRAQYGTKRPLEARITAPGALHDRLIIVDGTQVWVLTQSTNAFATRSPASIIRVDDETAKLKVDAYSSIWAAAQPI